MKSCRPWLCAVFCLGLTTVWAQQNQRAANIGYVYPAGGQQGTSFEVIVGGQNLGAISNAYVTGSGVRAVVVKVTRPLNQKQINDLRERLMELQKLPKQPDIAKEIAAIREKLAGAMKKAPPAIADIVTLQVTVEPDAPPTQRELRLGSSTALTNPLVFQIGQAPEFREPEKKETLVVKLPATINGQIMPGEVDRCRFTAAKGQSLLVSVQARALIPYLADAVPGWFQATVALFDSTGKELAYADDYRFMPDPVLFYRIPEDGEYIIEIKDSIYRGREDFVYRITVGELPFLTGVFPLGGKAKVSTPVELRGWNLTGYKINIEPTEDVKIHARLRGHISNLMPFVVDELPSTTETETDQPEPVRLPLVINGRINRPDDTDVFRFEGRANETIVAEVKARRLGSPLDSKLLLTDSAGQVIAMNDDFEDKGAGLNTHHADSYLTATLPANGVYFLTMADTQRKGGVDYAYRLRISPPRPDFELRVVPSSLSVRTGATVPVSVHVLRRDGFTNNIALAVRDALTGFKLTGNTTITTQDVMKVTLTAPNNPTKEPVSLSLIGRAKVDTNEVERVAVPADDMMQAFLYRHLVPAQELQVAVTGRPLRSPEARPPVRPVRNPVKP